MIVHWLIPGIYRSVEDLSKSNLASIRMRAGLVASNAKNIKIQFSAGDQVNPIADIVVVGKIGGGSQNGRANLWINQISDANKKSKVIILDYTDHRLDLSASPMGIFYNNVLPFIDKSVVSSSRIAHLLAKFFSQEITVIEDPIEIKITPPKYIVPNGEVTLLWFGHATNISYLVNYLQNNFLCDEKFKLIVLSNLPGLEILAFHQQRLRSTIKIEIAEWSLQNMINASKICHGCIIPSDSNDLKKAGVSSNRLITAFALGLPVSADVLDSYAPFSDYFHDIRKTPLSVFFNQLSTYENKVEFAQQTIVPMFSQEELFNKWKNFFLLAIQN
jgi:hypothetical protein